VDLGGTQDAPSPRRGDARPLPICGDAENWLALAAGGTLLLTGIHRRSAVVACLAVSSTPLLCCGVPAMHERDVLGHEFMGEVDPCSNLMDTHGEIVTSLEAPETRAVSKEFKKREHRSQQSDDGQRSRGA